MKRISTIIAAICCALVFGTAGFAQKKQDSAEGYNIRKAYEALNDENDVDKALQLVNEQLEETPDNVTALLLRIRICYSFDEYAQALSDVNHAIAVNKPKQSGIFKSSLYCWRAIIYSGMEENEKAAADYKTSLELARKDSKENVRDIAFSYGQLLYVMDRFEESDAIYRRMLKDDETDQKAMVGLARNLMDEDRCPEALELLSAAEKLDGSYSQIYKIRLQVYDKMGETDKAIDDGITYCEKDDDPLTQLVIDVMKNHQNYAVARIKATLKKTEKTVFWHIVLTGLYEASHDFVLAIREYDAIEQEYGKDAWIYANRARCYDRLGMTDKAIEEATASMEKDSDFYYRCARGDYYREAARYEEAIADFTSAIEEKPDNGYGYYNRGWCYELTGDKEKAMADYNLGIDIEKNFPYLYLMRGELLLLNGETEKAAADFEQVLQRDTVVRDGSCRQYALHFLGRDDEAGKWMQDMIDKEPDDCGNYYDKACLYSLMGRLDEALEAFRKCLDMGYRSFGHIEHDDDLDPIRELPGFKEAVSAAKERMKEQIKAFETEHPAKEVRTTVVDIRRHVGGTFSVPCEINGLALQMIFDTGASDVSISSVEANFMLKNGYLSEKDIKGSRYYQTADGQISEGTVITLHDVKIGDALLHSVNASVVKNQSAPLLFGQSAMERFGTITIDNDNSKLIIKQ